MTQKKTETAPPADPADVPPGPSPEELLADQASGSLHGAAGESRAPSQALVPASAPPLPTGVARTPNYARAIELGHVLAASGLYKDARDPAKAAVKVMIGLDLGITPTAAMQGIHTFEEGDKIIFLIEGKLLAGVVKARPDVEYKIIERTDEKVEIEFKRRVGGRWRTEEPNIVWTIEHAKKAVPKFAKKDTWANYPAVMLTWRALAEGIRLHFPDVISGQPIYLDEEFDYDRDGGAVREALTPKAEPLTTARAEELRTKAREVFDELREIDPNRMPPALFDNRVKGAEHSHERLEAVLASLEDLRDTERQVVDLKGKVAEVLDKPEAKKVIDTAERRSSNRERIDVLEAAIAEAAEAEEKSGEKKPDA
jgi:hypothetical protein